MTVWNHALREAAGILRRHRDPLLESWTRAQAERTGVDPERLHEACARELDQVLARLEAGSAEKVLEEDQAAAGSRADGESVRTRVLALRTFHEACRRRLAEEGAAPESVATYQQAMDELENRRLDVALRAYEADVARRVMEAEEQAARAGEKAREVARANDALRRSEAQSQHRAEQIGLLSSVVHRLAPLVDADRLMQEAAETIQARMNHTYVAVVVLDNDGVLVGRWAGRAGVGRRSAGRTQGPAGGIIGRALRKRAPQVVGDVSQDPDYHADVPGTHSEMVIPLLEGGQPVGALDFQAERSAAFDLDDVAVGETLAEFLVVALRNARLFSQARGAGR